VKRTQDKQFFQYRYEGEKAVSGLDGVVLPLYLAGQLETAIAEGQTVYVVEGEKDALSMSRAGYAATSKSGGAESKWHPENVAMFDGADVVIVADRDEAGEKAARMAYCALFPVCKSLRIVESRQGKDATDHLEAGFSPEEFTVRDDLVPPPMLEDGRIVTYTDFADISESGPPAGIPTGFEGVDTKNESGGVPKGQMTVVCARKKVGKSALMAQWASHMLDAQNRVLFVTLTDLTKKDFRRRWVRMQTGWADRPHSLQLAEDWDREVMRMRLEWDLKIVDAKDLGGRSIETIVPAIEALQKRFKFDVVFVDYAQKIRSSTEKDRVRAMEKVSNDLSDMAADRGFALVVGSQVSEEGRTRYSQEFEDDCGLMVIVSAPNGRDALEREFEVPYSRFGPSEYEFLGTWDKSRLCFKENS